MGAGTFPSATTLTHNINSRFLILCIDTAPGGKFFKFTNKIKIRVNDHRKAVHRMQHLRISKVVHYERREIDLHILRNRPGTLEKSATNQNQVTK